MLFVSCSKEKENDKTNSELTESEAKDIISSSLIIKNMFESSLFFNGRTFANRGTSKCDVLKIFKIEDGKFKYDFDSGCEFLGKLYKGCLVVEYKPNGVKGYKSTLTFDNVVQGGIKLNGYITYDVVMKNDSGHLFANIEMDLEITLKDGKKLANKGTYQLERVAGNETPMDFFDDVYETSGSGIVTGLDGVEKSVKIIKNLVFKSSECRYPLAGILEIKKGSKTYIVDFGDSVCGGKFKINGKEFSW